MKVFLACNSRRINRLLTYSSLCCFNSLVACSESGPDVFDMFHLYSWC